MRFLRIKNAPMLLVLASNNNVMADIVPNDLRASTLKILGARHGKELPLGEIDKLITEYNDRASKVDQKKGGLLDVTDSYDNVLFGLLCEISSQSVVQQESNKCRTITERSVKFYQAVRDITSILKAAKGEDKLGDVAGPEGGRESRRRRTADGGDSARLLGAIGLPRGEESRRGGPRASKVAEAIKRFENEGSSASSTPKLPGARSRTGPKAPSPAASIPTLTREDSAIGGGASIGALPSSRRASRGGFAAPAIDESAAPPAKESAVELAAGSVATGSSTLETIDKVANFQGRLKSEETLDQLYADVFDFNPPDDDYWARRQKVKFLLNFAMIQGQASDALNKLLVNLGNLTDDDIKARMSQIEQVKDAGKMASTRKVRDEVRGLLEARRQILTLSGRFSEGMSKEERGDLLTQVQSIAIPDKNDILSKQKDDLVLSLSPPEEDLSPPEEDLSHPEEVILEEPEVPEAGVVVAEGLDIGGILRERFNDGDDLDKIEGELERVVPEVEKNRLIQEIEAKRLSLDQSCRQLIMSGMTSDDARAQRIREKQEIYDALKEQERLIGSGTTHSQEEIRQAVNRVSIPRVLPWFNDVKDLRRRILERIGGVAAPATSEDPPAPHPRPEGGFLAGLAGFGGIGGLRRTAAGPGPEGSVAPVVPKEGGNAGGRPGAARPNFVDAFSGNGLFNRMKAKGEAAEASSAVVKEEAAETAAVPAAAPQDSELLARLARLRGQVVLDSDSDSGSDLPEDREETAVLISPVAAVGGRRVVETKRGRLEGFRKAMKMQVTNLDRMKEDVMANFDYPELTGLKTDILREIEEERMRRRQDADRLNATGGGGRVGKTTSFWGQIAGNSAALQPTQGSNHDDSSSQEDWSDSDSD